jgi:preprotein translocase subunit YajC
LTAFVFLGLLLVLVWFLLIQPQRRRQAQQREARSSVNAGDVILTAGGIYATVMEVREDDLVVRIAEDTTVRLDKRAVALVVERQDEVDETDEAPEEAPADEEPSEAART